MTRVELLSVYVAAGLAAASLVFFRSEDRGWSSVASAAAAFLLWPLWLPFALAPACERGADPCAREAERRIALAIDRARDAVRGTELEGVLTASDAETVLRAVGRLCRRLDAIETELGAAACPARRVTRLETLRDADLAALEEVRELTELLATELALARHGLSEGVEPVILELSARVEALQGT